MPATPATKTLKALCKSKANVVLLDVDGKRKVTWFVSAGLFVVVFSITGFVRIGHRFVEEHGEFVGIVGLHPSEAERFFSHVNPTHDQVD